MAPPTDSYDPHSPRFFFYKTMKKLIEFYYMKLIIFHNKFPCPQAQLCPQMTQMTIAPDPYDLDLFDINM